MIKIISFSDLFVMKKSFRTLFVGSLYADPNQGKQSIDIYEILAFVLVFLKNKTKQNKN